jgi:excisionase family DNA binding protein
MDVPEPIDVREAARILGCARSWVFTLIHRGDLSFKKQGKRFTLRRDEVERTAASGWLRNGEKEGRRLKVG